MRDRKWMVSEDGTVSIPEVYSQIKRIVYLDDHKLLRAGLIQNCINSLFKNAQVIEIPDGNQALDFIMEDLEQGNRIDLFITDVNHPGMNGIDICKAIRANEGLKKLVRKIPIVIICMAQNPALPKLKEDQIIDAYFCKADEPVNIMDAIEDLLLIQD